MKKLTLILLSLLLLAGCLTACENKNENLVNKNENLVGVETLVSELQESDDEIVFTETTVDSEETPIHLSYENEEATYNIAANEDRFVVYTVVEITECGKYETLTSVSDILAIINALSSGEYGWLTLADTKAAGCFLTFISVYQAVGGPSTVNTSEMVAAFCNGTRLTTPGYSVFAEIEQDCVSIWAQATSYYS